MIRCWILLAAWCLVHHAAARSDEGTTRVVSLVPGLTEILVEIGATNQLAGVSDYCRLPPEVAIPRVGGLLDARTEDIVRARADIALLYSSMNETARRLSALGMKVVSLPLDSLEDIHAAALELGRLTGRESTAVKWWESVDEKLQRLRLESDETSGPRVVIIVSRDPVNFKNIYQAGSGEFLGELAEIAGAKLAIPGAPPIDVERLLIADPDIIIDFSLAESVGDRAANAQEMLESYRRTLPSLRAVKSGAVYPIVDEHALVPGPLVVETAREYARIFAEWKKSHN